MGHDVMGHDLYRYTADFNKKVLYSSGNKFVIFCFAQLLPQPGTDLESAGPDVLKSAPTC